jgi:hypothetical protein
MRIVDETHCNEVKKNFTNTAGALQKTLSVARANTKIAIERVERVVHLQILCGAYEARNCVPTKARERAHANLLQLSRPDAGLADSRKQQFDPRIRKCLAE